MADDLPSPSSTRKHARDLSPAADFISLDVEDGDESTNARKRIKTADETQKPVAEAEAVPQPVQSQAAPSGPATDGSEANADHKISIDLTGSDPVEAEPQSSHAPSLADAQSPASGDTASAEPKRGKRKPRPSKEERQRLAQERAQAQTTAQTDQHAQPSPVPTVQYLPKSVAKNPKYSNATGKFNLNEMKMPNGKPVPFHELKYEKFVAHFLRSNKNQLAVLKNKTCSKAFSAYIQNYYVHVPIDLRGPLMESSRRLPEVFESCRDALKKSIDAQAVKTKAPKPVEKPLTDGVEPVPGSGTQVQEAAQADATPAQGGSAAHTPIIIEDDDPAETPIVIEDDDDEPGLVSDDSATPEPEEDVDEDYKAEVLKYYPQVDGVFVLRCLYCSRTGHSSLKCPMKTCSSCDSADHLPYACPSKFPCTKCRQAGHVRDTCPEKLGVPKSEWRCALCSESDHIEDNCHWRWRSYRPRPKDIKKVQWLPTECFYCGKQGHLATECGLRGPTSDSNLYSWTRTNWEQYVDPSSTELCIPALQHGSKPKPEPKAARLAPSVPRGPRAITHGRHENQDERDDEPFLRPRVNNGPPPSRNIRIANQQYNSVHPLPPRPRSPRRDMEYDRRYNDRNNDSSYRPRNDRFDSGRYGRERSFSPPPLPPQSIGYGGPRKGSYGNNARNGNHSGPPPRNRGRGGRSGGRGGRGRGR